MSTRTRTLAQAFVALLVIYLVTRFLAALPREPRLVFRNGGPSDIARLIAESESTKVDVGGVRAGGTVILPIEPRAGEVYSIQGNRFSGDELIRHLDYARRFRSDVRLGVDSHGCGWLEDGGVLHHDGRPRKREIGDP